jgi:hypothetical protein
MGSDNFTYPNFHSARGRCSKRKGNIIDAGNYQDEHGNAAQYPGVFRVAYFLPSNGGGLMNTSDWDKAKFCYFTFSRNLISFPSFLKAITQVFFG